MTNFFHGSLVHATQEIDPANCAGCAAFAEWETAVNAPNASVHCTPDMQPHTCGKYELSIVDYIGQIQNTEERLTPAEVDDLKRRMDQVLTSSQHMTKEAPTLTGVCRELAKDTIVMDSFSAHEEK